MPYFLGLLGHLGESPICPQPNWSSKGMTIGNLSATRTLRYSYDNNQLIMYDTVEAQSLKLYQTHSNSKGLEKLRTSQIVCPPSICFAAIATLAPQASEVAPFDWDKHPTTPPGVSMLFRKPPNKKQQNYYQILYLEIFSCLLMIFDICKSQLDDLKCKAMARCSWD